MEETTRKPAVAGLFYPSDPDVLQSQVDLLLEQAASSARKGPQSKDYSRVVIAPHAGYLYSGATAAIAYQSLDPGTKRVLILGPTHRVGIEGMALTEADFQETPLGRVPVDATLTAALDALPEVIRSDFVHAQEHSIEVHIPFLQRYLDGAFTVIPLAVGAAPAGAVAESIEIALKDPDTAVIVSSDLSHYLAYEQARDVDAATLEQIIRLRPFLGPDQACGAAPVSGMMRYARKHGWEATVLDARNSGDTAGDRSRVVGYCAVEWHPGKRPDSHLAPLAYNAIASELDGSPVDLPSSKSNEILDQKGAAFVRLELDGELRGCIGSLNPTQTLKEDVVSNALEAAFEDPRFEPLTKDELKRINLCVSVLSDLQRMGNCNDTPLTEAQVIRALRRGIDGVVLTRGSRRATFLPYVWDEIPDPQQFLEELKGKAGLPSDFWDKTVQVHTFQVEDHHLDRETANEARSP